MKGAPILGLAALALTMGALQLAYGDSTPSMTVVEVEVPLRPLAPGSSTGANSTNASVSFAACLAISCSTDLWYLNNTNASGTYYAKLVSTSTSGLNVEVTTLDIGIDNGSTNDQIKVATGVLTQSAGSGWIGLSAGSTNRIYATSLVTLLFGSGSVSFDVLVSSDSAGDRYDVLKATLTVT